MPYSILTIDLHNTIYDEALEYGVAMNDAITTYIAVAKDQGYELKPETVYRELSIAHRQVGSDWDPGIWEYLPSFLEMNLGKTEYTKAISKITHSRTEKSRQLTLSTAYSGVRETIIKLKTRGVRIYIVTEAAADAAAQSIAWLKLEGKVDGIYAAPSRLAPAPLVGTFVKSVPAAERGGLQKPHPLLLGTVAFEDAVRKGQIPSHVKTTDVFDIVQDEALLIPELPATSPVQKDVTSRLAIKDTVYAQILTESLKSMLYVGDSKYRDGLLARNAGIAFAYAAYGKKGQESEATRKSLKTMYAITGWNKEVLQLTQEAGRAESVNRLQPDFTFETSLSEAMDLFA